LAVRGVHDRRTTGHHEQTVTNHHEPPTTNQQVPDVSFADPVVLAFIVLPILVVVALAVGVWLAWTKAGAPAPRAWRAAGLVTLAAAAWMAVTWAVADSGALRRWDSMPPPFALFALSLFLVALRLAFSTVGRRLALHVPLWALVGVQVFRYPLELAMHRMYERGIMPVQMSYSGLNFDIVTGISAALVAGLVLSGRAGRKVVLAWNIVGMALLLNIVTVAILSTPRFAYFGGVDRLNVWVTYPPFVWLPAVLVAAALAGHLVIFRALLGGRE
jgi:hypothetical protein